MRKDKNLAIRLRKAGKSYNQINQILKVPKSTLSYWLKNVKLNCAAQKALKKRSNGANIQKLVIRNKLQTALAEKRNEQIKLDANKEFYKYLNNYLFITGISLYWAEGYKKGAYGSKWKTIDFANSDPEMIVLMIRFFCEICKVEKEKIKIQLMAHKNVNIEKAIKFWSRMTGVSKNNFFKTNISINKNSKGKRNTNSLPNGTIHIRICDVKLFFKLIGWIEGLKNYFNKTRGVA